MKYAALIGFVIMIGAQWYAPVSMILQAEKTIDNGMEYRFKTMPVDPSDPFRGKYITLAFEASQYITDDTLQTGFLQYSTVNAVIETGEDGFARIERLTDDTPRDGDYIAVQFQYAYDSVATIQFPFNQFYLEESKASEAEQIYWQSRTDSTLVCYAKVKILNGDAKLVDVVVNDSSIVDVVRRINAGKSN